jgi:hypothetical protein
MQQVFNMQSHHEARLAFDLSLHRLVLAALVLLMGTVIVGCDRGPAMYQVSGTVLYKDGSVPKGGIAVVTFQPTETSTAEIRKGATGAIGPDGSFAMSTRKTGDGVYAGEYDVMFSVRKAVMDPISYIPQKYSIPGESGYSVTVDGDIDDLKFEIEPLSGAGRSAAEGRPAAR